MSVKHEKQDALVRQAESLVGRLQTSKAWQSKDVGRTQSSRAIEVAQVSDTLRLFINWLRYQAARESDRDRFWSIELDKQKTTLAEALAADLNGINKADSDPMPTVRLFLGYFRRALVGADLLKKIRLED